MTLFKLIVLSSKKFMNAHEASDAQLLTHPQKDAGRGRGGRAGVAPLRRTCVFLAHPATFGS